MLFTLFVFPRLTHGIDYFWNKSSGGAFGVTSNWGFAPGGPGDADDTVNFELDRSTAQRYTVNGVNGQNNRLLVHNDALTLVLSDDYTLHSFGINPPSMVVGVANGEVGDVIITGATLGGVSSVLETRRVVLGQSAGSTGIVTASNLRWESDEEVYVGESGEGTLEIVGESNVTSRSGVMGRNVNSTGSATVSDSSSWTASIAGGIAVGGAGEGTLIISDGGTVYGGIGTIGSSSTAVGTATVTGSGSSWSCLNEFYVGARGRGTLTISAGGSVENHRSYIGEATGSVGSVSVNGNGSSWADSSDLFVGHNGDGTLTISSGGSVSNDRGFVAYREDSSGDINVTGIGSAWTNRETLFIGYEGQGSLAVSAGGMVSSATGSIASFDGSSGTVVVTGSDSTWNNSGALRVGDQGEGLLTISAGATVSNTNGYVGFLFDSTGEAIVTGDGSTWTNSGVLDIGTDSWGKLRIEAGGAVR
jgi:T5SS/PEP-CTERM-associated repeat protein